MGITALLDVQNMFKGVINAALDIARATPQVAISAAQALTGVATGVAVGPIALNQNKSGGKVERNGEVEEDESIQNKSKAYPDAGDPGYLQAGKIQDQVVELKHLIDGLTIDSLQACIHKQFLEVIAAVEALRKHGNWKNGSPPSTQAKSILEKCITVI